ncbi:hypothetical protein QBC39DRAFT_365355 [Podospora conica]|nr:hypothetical protein QBC39DRAFT_365355 [Schizothecium conicum]
MRRTVGLRFCNCNICLMPFANILWVVAVMTGRWCWMEEKRKHKGQPRRRKVQSRRAARGARCGKERGREGPRLPQNSDSIYTIDHLANNMGINSTEG